MAGVQREAHDTLAEGQNHLSGGRVQDVAGSHQGLRTGLCNALAALASRLLQRDGERQVSKTVLLLTRVPT